MNKNPFQEVLNESGVTHTYAKMDHKPVGTVTKVAGKNSQVTFKNTDGTEEKKDLQQHQMKKHRVESVDSIDEKKLTDAEMKKREEVAKAMERDNPGMPMGKKMAIATAVAKRVAEAEEISELSNTMLASYKKKAGEQARELDKKGEFEKANKRFSGILKATNKQFDNDKKVAENHLKSGDEIDCYDKMKVVKSVGKDKYLVKEPAEKEMTESTGKHRVSVTVSEPDSSAVSKRAEKMMKTVRLSALTPEAAIFKAKKYYTAKGYKVHDAEHVGMVNEDVAQDLQDRINHHMLRGVPYKTAVILAKRDRSEGK